MKEFRVTLHHKSGELANLANLLSARQVNLKSIAAVADGQRAIVCLIAEEVTETREALTEARMAFEESEVLSELIEDEPGEVADIAARLAEAGVNINSVYVLARESPLIELGFTVDDAKKAKQALTR